MWPCDLYWVRGPLGVPSTAYRLRHSRILSLGGSWRLLGIKQGPLSLKTSVSFTPLTCYFGMGPKTKIPPERGARIEDTVSLWGPWVALGGARTNTLKRASYGI